jgi:hypothetical protein
MMPTRRQTREQDRAYRIDAERALNAGRAAERNGRHPSDPDLTYRTPRRHDMAKH